MINGSSSGRQPGITLSLKNKNAIITGATRGIGKRIAEIYANAGANVVIADINQHEAQATANEIGDKGVKTMAVEMDVTKEDAVDSGFKKVKNDLGPVDILVSNAGIQIISPLKDLKFSDWKKLLAVHLDGGFLTSRAAIRQMNEAGHGGSIIFMGSVHSKEASKLKSPYVTAKHGLEGLAKVIAKEEAENGIRSNIICPGFVRTTLVEKQIPEQAEKLNITEEEVIKNVMLKDTVDAEFTTVDDIALVALIFAAFPSNVLTGQSLIASHGWFMQ